MDPWLVSPGEMVGQFGLMALTQSAIPALALSTFLPVAFYYIVFLDKTPSIKQRFKNMLLNIYKYLIDFGLGILDVFMDIFDIFVYIIDRIKNVIIGKRMRYSKPPEEEDNRSVAEMIGDYLRPQGQPGRGFGRLIGTIFLMTFPFGKITKIKWLNKVPFFSSIIKYLPRPKTRIVKTLTILSKKRIGIYLVNTKRFLNFLKTYPGNIYVFIKSAKVINRVFASFSDNLHNISNDIKNAMRQLTDLSNNISTEIYDEERYGRRLKDIQDKLNITDKMLNEIHIDNNVSIVKKSEKLSGSRYGKKTQRPMPSINGRRISSLITKATNNAIIHVGTKTLNLKKTIIWSIPRLIKTRNPRMKQTFIYHSCRNK